MIRLLTLILCVFIALPAQAQELNIRNFESLPILNEGRIKPIQSFADIQKKLISGDEQGASAWLAKTIFDPANAIKEPVFEIRRDTIKNQFELDKSSTYFSYEDLLKGLEKTQGYVEELIAKDNAVLTDDEKALLTLHDKALGYTNLLRSFSALMPIESGGNQTRFLDLKPKSEPAQMMMAAGAQSTAFKVLPAQWETGLWLSPWEMLLSGNGSPPSAALLEKWNEAGQAYRAGNAQNWSAAIEQIKEITKTQSQNGYSETRLKTEEFYRSIKPYLWIITLYAAGFIAALSSRSKTAFVLTIIGIAAHAASIALRIYILDRPPVGTLYESVLFVSLICASLGLIFAVRKKQSVPLMAGTLSALALLAISPALIKNGDSLEVLVAVLNTNFWLATHVICITIGYGVCILTAMLAHTALIAKALNKAPILWLKLQQNIYHLSLLALFFTTFGTILGGIWADQSWGRFWGWDPKENGALLIVLWLLWVQHGRLSSHIKPLGFVSLMAALNIIIALAWFGVNLLSVGLHSYGFIDGVAEGFAIFCAAEIILISALTLKIKTQKS